MCNLTVISLSYLASDQYLEDLLLKDIVDKHNNICVEFIKTCVTSFVLLA